MSARLTTTKQCISCIKDQRKANSICAGCGQIFCSLHQNEHQEELNERLQHLLHQCRTLDEQTEKTSADYQHLFENINQWEKESIQKIHDTADRARKSLNEFVQQRIARLRKICQDLVIGIEQAEKSYAFSEKNLEEWNIHLDHLRRQVNQTLKATLSNDPNNSISLIKVKVPDLDFHAEILSPRTSYNIYSKERFHEKLGPVDVEEEGLLATHNGQSSEYGYVRGKLRYDMGSSAMRFRIEQFTKPYALFFGCLSGKSKLREGVFQSDKAVGWFGGSWIYGHSRSNHDFQGNEYNGEKIERGDILTLVFHRESNTVKLINKRIHMACTLDAGSALHEDAWRFLVILSSPGDSVRILPHA